MLYLAHVSWITVLIQQQFKRKKWYQVKGVTLLLSPQCVIDAVLVLQRKCTTRAKLWTKSVGNDAMGNYTLKQ